MALRFSGFVLDPDRYVLEHDGRRVAIRPKVFDLLAHLVRHRQRVVLRRELVDVLWGGTVVGPGSLSGLVNELRQALGESGRGSSSIRTVHGRGYQFVAEIEVGLVEVLDRESRRRGWPPLPRVVVESFSVRKEDERTMVESLFDWIEGCAGREAGSHLARSEDDTRIASQSDGPSLLRAKPPAWSTINAPRSESADRGGRGSRS